MGGITGKVESSAAAVEKKKSAFPLRKRQWEKAL